VSKALKFDKQLYFDMKSVVDEIFEIEDSLKKDVNPYDAYNDPEANPFEL